MKPQTRPALVIAIAIASFQASAFAEVTSETLGNLNQAYQNESNAVRRYEAFAKKADTEKLPQIARLFRAAAESEAIHRNIQKKAILKLGGKPATFEFDRIPGTSTAENLKTAIKDEIVERDSLYPVFLAKARADTAKAAVRAFNYAIAGEKRHAEYFQSALDQIGNNPATTYYLCDDCGLLLGGCFLREAPEGAIGSDRRAGKWGLPVRYWRAHKKLRAEDLGLEPDQVSDRLISLGHKRLLPKEATAALAIVESRAHGC